MDIKEEIFNYISIHEAIVSSDMGKKDKNIEVRFTTFGNRAGCRALYDVIQMMDDDMKLKIVDMMRGKRAVAACSCDNGIIDCPGCKDADENNKGKYNCAGCSGSGKVTCGKCGGKNGNN